MPFYLVDNSTESDSKSDKAKNRHDIPKGMLPIYIPADAFPLIIKGHLLKRKPDGSVIDVISKKNLVTAIRKGAPKEDLASMVLVNPSPELNLDLTENEAQEINNRNKTMEITDTFNNETSVEDFPEAANAVTHENISTSPVNKTIENSKAGTNDINFNDNGFYNSKNTNKNTVSINETDQKSAKIENLNKTRSFSNSTDIDQSNSEHSTSARNSKESDKFKSSIDYNQINYIQSQPSSRTNGVSDNKQINKKFSTTDRTENTTSNKNNVESNNTDINETNKEKMNNNETFKSLAYNLQNNIKSVSKGDSFKLSNKTFTNDKALMKSDKDSGDANIKTQADEEASLQNKATQKENNFEENHQLHNNTDPANPEEEADQPLSQEQTYEGKNLKGTDSKISNGVGSLSQTLELHSGNGKVHVSPHHVDHQSLFSGKLSDRFKMHHLTPMFGGRTEITKAPSKVSKNQTNQAVTKSILNYDHPFSNKTSNITLEIDRTGKELDELYKKAHRTIASNSATNKASNGKKQLKNNYVYRSQDKTVSSGNKTTNLQKIQKSVKILNANHSRQVEEIYSSHTDMDKIHNKVFQVDKFIKTNDFGIYENDHGDNNPIILDTATSKLRTNFIPSQTKNVRPTNRNINNNVTQYGHNVMLVFSKGIPTQLQTKSLPGNLTLLTNTTALNPAYKNTANKGFRNISLNSNLNRNSCKTPVAKTVINIQCVDNEPIKQNTTTLRKNHELPEVSNTSVTTNNANMTGEKPIEHSVNGAGISNHKVYSNGAGLQKHQTSGVGTGLKTEVVNNSTRSTRKYNTSNENLSTSFKNDSKSSVRPFHNTFMKVIQGSSNTKPIKLPASKNFNKTAQIYKQDTNNFPEIFPNHGVTKNSTPNTTAATKTIDNIREHASRDQKNIKTKSSLSELQNQSKLYSYTLKNVTAILDLPEPRINKDKVGESDNAVQIHESNERKEKFNKPSHTETGKRKNLDSVQNHEINKNLDNDISSLVRAVEDVSKDAADLAEEFDLNDDAKLSKLEDIVNTDYNENFLNNPAVLKTLDRKALQARKDEIDRLLKLLDKEEHETAFTRTSINKYRNKLGLSGNEDAEINELTRIFHQIDARVDDKVSEKRSHNRRPKRVKIDRYIPTNLRTDKSVSFYRRPVDDEHPYDIGSESDEHSITPIKGNINLNGHRLNFISEESLTNNVNDQPSYDKKKHKNRKRRLYNLTSSFNWQDHVHVNDDKEKTATDEEEFEAEQSSLLKYHPNPLHFTTQRESSKEIQKQEKLRDLLTSYESHIREIAGLNKSNALNQTGLDVNIDKTANQKHDIAINEEKKRKYRRILGIISKIVDAIDPEENKENDMQNKVNEVSRTELQKPHNNTNADILNVREDEKLTSSAINAPTSNSSGNMHNATKLSNHQNSEQNSSDPGLSNNSLDAPDTLRNNSGKGKENVKNMSSNFQHTSKQRVTEQHKPFKDKQQFPIEKPYKKPKQNRPPTISSNQLPNKNTGKNNTLQNSGQLSTQHTNWQRPLQTISTVVSPAQSSNPTNQVIILNPNNQQPNNQRPEIAYTISNMKPGSYFQPELSNPQYHNMKISPIQPPTPLVGTPLFHKPTHLLIPIGYPNTMAATQRPQPPVETSLEEQISHPPSLYPVTGKIANEYIQQSQSSNSLTNLLNSDEESQYFNRNKSLDAGDDDLNINLDDHVFSQVGNGNIKEYTRTNNDVDYDTSNSIFQPVQPGTIVENFIQPQRDRIQDQILLNLNPLQAKAAPTIQSHNLFPGQPHIDPESHQFDHLGRHHHFLHHHQKLSPYTTNIDGSINILPYRHASHHKINGAIDHHRHNNLHAVTPDVDTQGNLLIPDFSHLKDQQTSVMVMGNKVQLNQPKGQSQEHIHLTVKDPQGAHLHFDHVRPYSKTNKPITIPIKVPTKNPSTAPFNPGKYHYLNLNTLSRKHIAAKRTKNPNLPSPPGIKMHDMNPLPPAVRPRPLINSRPRPLLKPHHPPGFKSLFEHVKKQNILKDTFHIDDDDNFQFGKRDDTSLLASRTNLSESISTQNETDDPISWAKEMLMKENINAKMLRSRKRIPHAWTENKFAPRKGIPFHRSGHYSSTNKLTSNKKLNNRLTTNISNSNLTKNTVNSKHFNISSKMHKRHHHHRRQHHHTRLRHKHKHRSKKLFSFNLDPETILDREETVENNHTDNVYKQKKTVLDRFEKLTKPISSMTFATPTTHKHRLIRISVVASAENSDREYKKEHIHKKNKVKKVQNYKSPIINDSKLNKTKGLTDFDILSLDLVKSKKRNISHLGRKINLNVDDETTLKLTSDKKYNPKTVASTEENDDNYIYNDNESETGHKGTLVEEENFPKFISVSDFKFSDLPKLPEGKSYVLSTPKPGMCVFIIW